MNMTMGGAASQVKEDFNKISGSIGRRALIAAAANNSQGNPFNRNSINNTTNNQGNAVINQYRSKQYQHAASLIVEEQLYFQQPGQPEVEDVADESTNSQSQATTASTINGSSPLKVSQSTYRQHQQLMTSVKKKAASL